jgi:hypothetical protein
VPADEKLFSRFLAESEIFPENIDTRMPKWHRILDLKNRILE